MEKRKKSFSLLIVDDDKDDFFLLQEAFKAIGNENKLRHLSSGEYLREYLTREGPFLEDKDWTFPELILLDLNMPRKDGREILAEIKSDSKFMKIPVIIYTTSNNPEDEKICMELGADSFVMKPDSFDMIIKFTERLCKFLMENIKK